MVIWITGVSSGIGRACAQAYAKQGHQLILTSSSAERLQPVADECLQAGAAGVSVLPYDFSNNTRINTTVDKAWQCFGHIDITMLNAGISQRTRVEDTDEAMLRKIMEVNYFAPCLMAKELLPLYLQQGHGHFAVTSSIAGKFGFPLRSGYSSSKHALYGFFETLRAEYYDQGIRVTMICPGRVRTNISLYALDKGGKAHGKMDAGQAGGITPEAAAKTIVKAIRREKNEVLVGAGELIMVYIKRFFPNLCVRLARKIKPE